jgi:SAM-dependent methyltransferase
MVEALAVRSADVMAESIVQEFRPQTVVDVGCGTGALLEALKKRGCAQVFGLEYSDAALTYCRERGLEVRQFDLERDQFCDDRTFDVAISMEVAEHLPARMADTYIDLINQLSDRIVFTAATLGQGEMTRSMSSPIRIGSLNLPHAVLHTMPSAQRAGRPSGTSGISRSATPRI